MDEGRALALLRLAEDVPARVRGAEAKDVLAELDRRYADLTSATEWFANHQRTDESLRLASSLVPFWMATKRLDHGLMCLGRALELPGGDDNHRCRALFDAGYLAFWKGDDERSTSLHHDALELGHTIGNPTITALALVGLARIALRADIAEARRLCHEALVVTEGTTDREGRSSALHVLAVAAQMTGDLQEARDLMRQRIALGRETGNLATVAIESNNLSMVERQLGNVIEAATLARQAFEISARRGDSLSIAWTLNGLAASVALLRDFRRAATLIGAADAAMESAGGAWPPDELVHYDRTVSMLKDAMGSVDFEQQRAKGHSMTEAQVSDFALSTGDAPTESSA